MPVAVLLCSPLLLLSYTHAYQAIVLATLIWQNWKENLMRFSAIGLANVMLLFLLGLRYFSSFLDHMLNSVHDGESNAANHSIQSFIWFLRMSGMGIFNEQRQWIAGHSGLIEAALYIFFGVCFLSVLVNSYIKNSRGFNFDLLLLCTIGGMTLPSVNHDYTLPLLALPFALSLSTWHSRNYIWSTTITILMIVVSSFAYSLTLFPIEHKPLYLQNSLPMIFLIMAIVTIQNLAQKGRA